MDLTQASSQSTSAQQRAGKVPVDPHLFDERPFLKRLSVTDWLFALAMVAGAGFALFRYYPYMNYYDKLVLCCAVPTFVVLG
ncbi:MAG: c-type cytochrome biogenesis protein CcsB, partial [Caballeronia sp.]